MCHVNTDTKLGGKLTPTRPQHTRTKLQVCNMRDC